MLAGGELLSAALAIEASKDFVAHRDKEDEVEERDDDVVGAHHDVALLLDLEDRLDGCGIEHAASVHSRHNAANLIALSDMLAIENVAHSNGNGHRQEAADDGLELCARIATCEAAAEEHHRDGKRYCRTGGNLQDCGHTRNVERKVANDDTYGVEDHHRAELVE